jgi:hypothetical protein
MKKKKTLNKKMSGIISGEMVIIFTKRIVTAFLICLPLLSFSQVHKSFTTPTTNQTVLNANASDSNTRTDKALNNASYISLPEDSVYTPEMTIIQNTDDRVSHLVDRRGKPINPLSTRKSNRHFKDGGSQHLFYDLTPDRIDFVKIEEKIYYRLYVSNEDLLRFLPESIIDFDNYPGFILLEIKEDINELAREFLQNGADSVHIINDNNIRIYKPRENLYENDARESYFASEPEYKGYYTYVRLEPALYLPLKNRYPEGKPEIKAYRTTNSRHFANENGEIDAVFTLRPTSYPIMPEGLDVELSELTDRQKEQLKWVELPASYPVPSGNNSRAVYIDYFDETFYGHSVYCTNDESHPYVWISSPSDGNYLGTVGAMEDDDFWSGDEHNYNRIHDKFDITSIQDGSDVTAAEYETYLPNIAPFTTGDCDGLINWEEVQPEIKDMWRNITSANNIYNDGSVDYYTHNWYNDAEDGTQYYIASGWPWDRGDLYTGFDCDFNASGLTDVEGRLAGNWYVVGVADGDENNQNPTYWEAVATYNYYSNFRVSYIPCCQVPDVVTAYANGSSSNSVCPGGSVNLSVGSFSGGGCACGSWRYAWYNGSAWWNGSSFSSGSPVYSSGYSSINTSINSSTTFTLRMDCSSGVCSNYTSDNVAVNVYNLSSAASSISGTSTICPGESTVLSVSGGSLGANASWNWYQGSCGGTLIGTGNSITVSPASNTTYYVRAEGTCNTTSCVSQTVTVNTTSVSATSASASPSTITPGNSSTLSVSGGSLGSGANWVWYSGSCGGTVVGTGASINVSPTVNTTYYVRAEGDCNNTSCVSVTVYVEGSVTICTGDVVRLSPNGGYLGTVGEEWQWYSGSCGGTYVGAGSSIDVSPTSTTTYYVRSEGFCNTTGCASMQVIVNSLSTPASSISGTNSNICVGGNSTLNVNGGSLGTGASWEWYSGSCGSTYVGSGSSIVVDPGTTTTYYVRAEGSCNTTSCVSYTVNVVPDPSISITSNVSEICTGGSVSFTQNATGGSGTVIDQWQYSTDGATWTNWTTSSNPTYNNITSPMYFRCIRTATNQGCNDGISNTIFIDVYPDPNINTQPVSPDPICVGGTTGLMTTSAEGGTGSFSYQWQYYNGSSWNNVSNGTPSGANYSGALSNTFSAAGFTTAGVYEYRCLINQSGNGCGQAITNTVSITVEPDPGVSIIGAETICSGGSASLLASESGGTGTYSYQWQSSSDGSSWSNISGATSSIYSTPGLTSTTHYHVIINASGSGCNSATSNNQIITVVPDPSISTHPNGATICSGGTHGMTVVASGGTPSINYQWQSSPDNSTWTDITGATSANYTTPALSSTMYYRVVVNATGTACDGTISNVATVTVNSPLNPGTISTDQTICYNTSPTTLVGTSPTGGDGTYTYQWQSSANCTGVWSDISGATAANYSPGPLTQSTCYRRMVTDNLCGVAYSTPVSMSADLLLHYTFNDAQQPTTNLVNNPNGSNITNGTEGNYQPGWDASLHTDAILVSNWSSGYNGGVGSPATGFHARWVFDGIDGSNDPCMFFQDENNTYGLGHRWLGISQNLGTPSSLGLSHGDVVTVSWYQKTDVSGKGARVGLYHKRISTGTYSFESNIATINVTNAGAWERVSFTTTIGSNWDLSANCKIYVYGHSGVYGKLWVDKVQIEENDAMTQFVDGSVSPVIVSDYSGNENHGTIDAATAPDWISDGVDGGAYNFDGVATKYIRSGSVSFSPTDWTISVWVMKKSHTISSYPIFLSFGLPYIACNGSGSPFRLSYSAPGQVNTSGTTVPVLNQWYHVVATSDASGTKLYVNGTLEGSNSSVSTNTGGVFDIGRHLNNNNYRIHGEVDDVRIYGKALSSTEIENLYKSSSLRIDVQSPPTSGTIAAAQSICTGGDPVAFSSSSSGTGDGTITYRWEKSVSPFSSWSTISGATGATYDPPAGLTATTRYRRITISTLDGISCESSPTVPVEVTVVPDPTVDAPTFTNSVICAGGSTVASANVSGGTGTLSYQWQYYNGSSWVNVSNGTPTGASYAGASTTTLTITGTTAPGSHQYRLHASNSLGCGTYGSASSYTVDEISDGGTVSANPSTVICAGETVDLSLTGYNGNIQWQTDASGSWQNIAGATSSTYTTTPLPVTTSFRAVVTNGVCSSSSSNINIVSVTTPDLTGISGNDYIWTGANSETWDGYTTNNWLKFISGSVFEIPASVPDNNDNVFIRSSGGCFTTPPVVNTVNVAECHNLTIDAGNTLNINTGSDLKIFGDIENNGTVNVSGTSPIEIHGDWNNNNSFVAGNGLVIFDGTSPQNITTNGDSFYDVSFNNTGGSTSDLILLDDFNITHSASFSDGIVNAGSYSVIFADGATTNSGTTSSFVNGEIVRSGSTAFTYPTGDVPNLSGSPRPIWAPVKTEACASSTITAQYFYENPPYDWWFHNNNMDPTIDHVTDREYWDLTTDNATPAVTLFWTDNTNDIHSFGTTTHTEMTSAYVTQNLTIAHYNTSQNKWNDQGASLPTTIYFDNGQLQTTVPFPNYSPVTFASKRADHPLPVELTGFSAECRPDGHGIDLQWTTASETNNNYFTLMRSTDGESFYEVNRINGNGTSNHIHQYLYNDENAPSGKLYYKLLQTDFDGSREQIGLLACTCESDKKEPNLQLYPVITRGNVHLVFNFWTEGNTWVKITDMSGRTILQTQFDLHTDKVHKTIDVSGLASGMYMLSVHSSDIQMTKRFQKH